MAAVTLFWQCFKFPDGNGDDCGQKTVKMRGGEGGGGGGERSCRLVERRTPQRFTPRVFATRASWPSGVDTDGGVDWRERSWRNQWISTNPRSTPVAVSPYHLGAWHGPCAGTRVVVSRSPFFVTVCGVMWLSLIPLLVSSVLIYANDDFWPTRPNCQIYSFIFVSHVWNIFNTRDIVSWTRVSVRLNITSECVYLFVCNYK